MSIRYVDLNNKITEYAVLKDVMYGGKGVITMISPSGNSHQYLFSRPINQDDFPDDIRFVYALHEDKRFYVGMIEQGRFRLTRNSRFTPDTEIVRGAHYFMKMISDERIQKSPMTLVHGDRCCKCGRKLDSKFGRIHGCGKKCFKKLRAEEENVGI